MVTHHAKQIIVQFMAACCGKSKGRDDDDAEDAQAKEYDIPGHNMALSRVHDILRQMSTEESVGGNNNRKNRKTAAQKAKAATPKEGSDDESEEGLRQTTQIKASMVTTGNLWPMDKLQWPDADPDVRTSSVRGLPNAGDADRVGGKYQ